MSSVRESMKGLGCALVAAVGLLACSDAKENPAGVTTTTTTASRAAQVREVDVEADLVRRPGGQAVTSSHALLIEPIAGSALLSFPAAAVNTACLRSAILAVPGSTGGTPVVAWVSIETDAATMGDGDSLGSFVVVNGSPAAGQAASSSDDLEWDVTDLVLWSRSHQATSASVVLVLKPEFTAGSRPVELGASEGGKGAVLRLTEDDECV